MNAKYYVGFEARTVELVIIHGYNRSLSAVSIKILENEEKQPDMSF